MSISRRNFIKFAGFSALLLAEKNLKAETAKTMIPDTDFRKVFYAEIKRASATVSAALGMLNMIPVNGGSLGEFPWYWQSGTNFNAKTYTWLNKVFAYNADGYAGTNGSDFTTEYFNILLDTAYVLSAADESSLNNANLANAALVNTIITDWATTQGAIPPGFSAQTAQLNYIMTNVLAWGTAGLTLGQLRSSTNPMKLLPNIPGNADTLVSDLMTYLANTSSVANIQAAVLSYNNQLAQMRTNISPAPAAVGNGWMQTIDDKGNLLIVPQVDIQESTANIQNNLLPASGNGKSFTVNLTVDQSASNQADLAAFGGKSATGNISSLVNISPQAANLKTVAALMPAAGSLYDLGIFSADSSQQTAQISLTFNGVTTVTPLPAAYNITSGKGWFNPAPIGSAVNYNSAKSGYKFLPAPQYKFGSPGDFGYISRLMISRQPVMTMNYATDNYVAYQNVFDTKTAWDLSFLGISLNTAQSYYQSSTSYDQDLKSATVTMIPITPTDQLAYVVGGEFNWLGS